MLELKNGELRLHVLHPQADAARLGPRYCWGGYIWQVEDLAGGPLLTGPEWPEPAPTAFNGQGLPESFRHRTLEGRPLTWQGNRGVALGAGELETDASGNVQVIRPCSWEIARREGGLDFCTAQDAAGFYYALERELELAGREIRSTSRLTNRSPSTRLTLEWFAHPFFPLVAGGVRAEVPLGTTLAENAGFVLRHRSLSAARTFVDKNDGHMERSLRLPPGKPLSATLAHPAFRFVEFETSFAPDSCVIWGNDRTFSFEPYQTLDLAPGETREWSLTYRFGASSGISPSDPSSLTSPPR